MRSVKIFDSIDAIDEQAWNSLAHGRALMQHGWFKTLEQTSAGSFLPRYLVLYEQDRLVAATVFRLVNTKQNAVGMDSFLFGKLRPFLASLGISSSPIIAAIPFRGYTAPLLVDACGDPATAGKYKQVLLDAAREYSRGAKTAIIFPKVVADDRDTTDLLRRQGYARIIAAPVAYLDITWPSFDGYRKDLSRISKSYPRKINFEINRNRREGIEIAVFEEPSPYEDSLYRLAALNARKYNMPNFAYEKGFFSALSANMPGKVKVYAAFKRGQLVGMSLFLISAEIWGEIWDSLLVGVDHERAGKSFTYFNLVFYQPIKDAIAARCRRIYYGNSHYELKIKRGCRLLPVNAFYKPSARIGRVGIGPFYFIHRAWNRRKRPEIVRNQLRLK